LDKNIRKNQLYYYRLKQIDFDSHFEYSDIQSVMIRSYDDQIIVYPNPVSSKLYFQIDIELITQDELVLELFDVLGRRVIKQVIANETASLSLSNLPKGVYSYRISDNKQTLKSDKLLVK
jgi:hypothetical protein